LLDSNLICPSGKTIKNEFPTLTLEKRNIYAPHPAAQTRITMHTVKTGRGLKTAASRARPKTARTGVAKSSLPATLSVSDPLCGIFYRVLKPVRPVTATGFLRVPGK
jgi:hypothetical protein